MVTEGDWVVLIAARLRRYRPFSDGKFEIKPKLKLAYEQITWGYESNNEVEMKASRFETDLAIVERYQDGRWIPRVVLEAKIRAVTTHDALTYSAKASSHRSVHPYLRYGVMLGERQHYPLPGRLFHHGAQFDFLVSFRQFVPSDGEMARFLKLVRSEIKASQTIERFLSDSRRKDRKKYTLLHRRLQLS